MAERDIMIVDDNPANLKLLEAMLLQQGHEVRSFPLGRLALAAAEKRTPDLILLDVNMPEMNGYEVCERLKSMAKVADVPVIFLSALNETDDKLKAFQAGGVDYITKPFQFQEVHARVETHLSLHGLQRALRVQNENLEKMVAARTRELSAANGRLKMLDRSKNDFLNLISHEFRTPLNGLLGVGEIILDEMAAGEQNNQLREMYVRCRQNILAILDDALLLTRIDVGGSQFRSTPVSLSAVVSSAVEGTAAFAASRNVSIILPGADSALVAGDQELLVIALRALLETAVKFSEKGSLVRILRSPDSNSQAISIASCGRTIPERHLAKFFDLYSIGEAITPGGDLGVRPALAQQILLLFGGSVRAENLEPAGIRLTITLMDAISNTSDFDPMAREPVLAAV